MPQDRAQRGDRCGCRKPAPGQPYRQKPLARIEQQRAGGLFIAVMMVVDMPRMTNKATTMVNSWRSDLFMRCSLLVDRRQDSGYRNRRIGLIGLAGLAGSIGGHGMTCLPGCARMACPHGRDGRSLRRT